ncbi:apolipoprotein N-acyltransferase [Blattabacterium cuenoti]|uniref:apolipoprotein N-acyltransferase n=1 Tax=Blattabacterium cuenoti TaxID=1653831 RepID=UPI00163D0194|nr:apolipoprotein N-acyltransferase [Blattabacterium cuenoti]
MSSVSFKNNKRIQFFFCSLLSGFLLGLGWPTYGNPLFLFIAFVPLLYLEESLSYSSFKKIFFWSFLTFFTWNALSTWWLSYAKKPNGDFAIIEAYLIPVMLNSFFMSIVFSIYSYVKKNVEDQNIGDLFLVCIWISFEKMHLEWELSWPWLNLGNGFSNHPEWIQWYEYTGILGGTLWIWSVNIGLMKSITEYQKNENKLTLYKNIFFNVGKIFFLIFISNYLYSKCEEWKGRDETVDVFILQPNIDPYHQKYKISTEKLIKKLQTLIDKKIFSGKKNFIIAPETVLPGYGHKISMDHLTQESLISLFRNHLKKKYPKTVFITGIELYALSYTNSSSKTSTPIFMEKEKRIQWLDIFNSVIQIGTSDDNIEIHHKSKLVPAVETFPYKGILFPILGNILLNFGGSVMEHGKQEEPVVFIHPDLGIKVAPIICYESIFGEYVSKFFKKNAEFMIIITNDGWWGFSQGYKQHLYYARLRAIENRKYIARSANTGVSCIIDDKGQILSFLPYGRDGVLSSKVRLNRKKTFYIKYGDYFSKISIITSIIIFIYTIVYRIYIRKLILKSG